MERHKFGRRFLAAAIVSGLGVTLLSGCEHDGSGSSNPSGDPGAAAHRNRPEKCKLVLTRNGDTYTGRAELKVPVAAGSMLVYHATYEATWRDGNYRTTDELVPVVDDVKIPAVHNGQPCGPW